MNKEEKSNLIQYRRKYDDVDLIIPDKDIISDYIEAARKFIQEISSTLGMEL